MLDPVRAKARVIVFATAAFVGGILLASGLEWTTGSYAATLLQTAPAARETQPIAELSEGFIAISESVTPAVVNIRTERTRQLQQHPPIPEQFRQFFDLPEGTGEGQAIPQFAGGTGFLITEDGYILTNNHVVEGADKITVILQNRREYQARVIGRDPTTDVAIIKIEGEEFPNVRFGDPGETQVGEWVVAIGNPLGLDFTVTAGIVSAKGRGLPVIRESLMESGQASYAIESFIQTDAAINPGNSGGPLVNIRGEVIGINSALASGTGYYAGYGFAIPIDLARRVADDLIRYGKVRRPILGVSITDVTTEDVEVYELPSVSGAVVQGFGPESPAEEAGLRPGDVIIAVDGRPVNQVNQLQRVIAEQRPGEVVTLDVIRYGEQERFRVRLTEAETPTLTITPEETVDRTAEGRLGIRVAPLTEQLARELDFGEAGGVVIMDVRRFGPAGRKAIAPGLKVLGVDREAIRDVRQFQRLVAAKNPGDIISLRLQDAQGGQRIVNIRIPQ